MVLNRTCLDEDSDYSLLSAWQGNNLDVNMTSSTYHHHYLDRTDGSQMCVLIIPCQFFVTAYAISSSHYVLFLVEPFREVILNLENKDLSMK